MGPGGRGGPCSLARASAGLRPLRHVLALGARLDTRNRELVSVKAAAVAAPVAVAITEEELLRSTTHEAGLHIEVKKVLDGYQVNLQATPRRPMLLHWAVGDWQAPSSELWPPGTRGAGDKAAETEFDGNGHVKMYFSDAVCPPRLVFVLRELQPEAWLKDDGGTDFVVHLKPPGTSELVDKVLAAEGTYTHWSLFNRFCLAIELLDAADSAGPEGMALIYTWLRLSSLRQLDWYRRSNYQSKDIAHVQKTLAERVGDKARSAKHPWSRMLARMALEGLPRGGGNGDDIRMGILHIMRSHGIREGHRPGLHEPFLEQLHQKLHTNTTPDDVVIVSAYLAFLHSGNHDDYWRVLWDMGRLSKADLENFSQPITAWPMHLPHLIDPFNGYLWLLKVTHSGADLDTSAEMAKGYMDDDLRWHLFDLLSNRDAWWAPGKIVEVRGRLAHYWKQPGSSRDLLLLDIALESWFRLLVERQDNPGIKRESAMEMVTLILRNALVSADDPELSAALGHWEWAKARVAGAGADPNAATWALPRGLALEVVAAVQRVQLALAAHMDRLYGLVQPHAEAFAASCKSVDPKFVINFGEEVARGRPLFRLSPLLQRLETELYATGHLPPWQVVSTGAGVAVGLAKPVPGLADVQGATFDVPTVLLAERITGNEDIPANIVAVITRDAVDVLSHAAIRARAQQVLLACTHTSDGWAALQRLAGEAVDAGKPLTVTLGADGSVEAAVGGDLPGIELAVPSNTKPSITLQQPKSTDRWVLTEPEFEPGLVGAKALNCAALVRARGGAIPEEVGVPASLALPLGTFERVVADPVNAGIAQALEGRLQALEAVTDDAPAAIKELVGIRQLVATQLKAPDALVQEVASTAAAAGLIPSPAAWAPGSAGWAAAWSALRSVWASKWTDRAWLSRRAAGLPDSQLAVGVLLQAVVPAHYAFVLHTAHPVTGEAGAVYGELVLGMGEALVGNHPGRALSFSAPLTPSRSSSEAGAPHVAALPSKHTSLHAAASTADTPLLIARSDANGEDLAELAGAGLYDSVPFAPLEPRPAEYASDPLITDEGFRTRLLEQLAGVGAAVRDAFHGVEQDVEGVVSADGSRVWVVQSRPQVLHVASLP